MSSSEESPCDDKTRPKQNQTRGLWRGVRHHPNVISPDGGAKYAVLPCNGTGQLRFAALHRVASVRKQNSNNAIPQTIRLTGRSGKVGSKRENGAEYQKTVTEGAC